MKLTTLAILAAATTPAVMAGPLAYGICQTGCNALVVACYAGAGAVFGTVVASPLALPAVLACNAALGTCTAACAVTALLAPTP